MYRSGERHSLQQNGWDTTSQDYHEHLSRVAKMPSIHPNVPQYPNVHSAFHNKVASEEENESHHNHHQHNHNRRSPQFQEKVEVMEFKEERFEHNRGKDTDVFEEVVDVKADDFIQQKHRRFELCKWNTFAAH
ncbi:uncharacterized protein LOC125315454 isoform X1 [Rhodamnia argentea]|uniref:Uncharacterized protein LOC125315454 isoform X1 n=1 Tax=Rhodamnia argentea TaxID=178133 RepID=A0ABM3HIM7_9MYRT|nr:uncharacterized protein LOC125315454 isoform X1 [Rhodamnia argentea]